MPNLGAVLSYLRANSTSQRAKGTYFEKLCVAFLRQDPGMQQQFSKVWLYADWAKQNGQPQTDTGIDIVAEVCEGGVCAAQCKFYAASHAIQKADIDSFFTASGKHPFTRRLIFDTTDAPWSKNAEAALVDQQIPTSRLGLDRIDEAVDWSHFLSEEKAVVAPKKQPRPHQAEAVAAVEMGFTAADRGKLLMACGTGKTFTGLKIAEKLAGPGKWVLFLVPSLSLMSQSIREWSIDSETSLRARAVCSDTEVGRRPGSKDDMAEFEAQDLDTPATTNAARLAESLKADAADRMTVVFATYQSIQVVSAAQKHHGLPDFDIIICDEAHRTTGVVFPGDDSRDSNFVKVHDQGFLRGKKRLYMTATPRIFGDTVKAKAGEESVELCSMDDSKIYGETLFERGFGWAVENGLLTDYKVVVLAVDEAMVSAGLQLRLADSNNELKLDDATKIIGCYKALTKSDLKSDVAGDALPMRRGLAFCRDIASSKLVQSQFAATVADFLASDEGQENDEGNAPLSCELEHVDGTFMAKERTRLLDWLKESPPGEVCRILTNARCLSEGVDVPALDAILFMHPRKSQIDVVQSVGRVMRRAEGKQMGYVILPIGIPAGVTAEDALNDNERYRVVWQILNALRSHDERFDATINKIDLGEDVSGRIEIVAVSNKLPVQKSEVRKPNIGHGSAPADDDGQVGTTTASVVQGSFVFDEVSKAIMARIVKKCGKRDYWENWAGDIAKIAQKHITRITALVDKPGTPERTAFEAFLAELRGDLNDSITEGQAVEMLAQHLITLPIFEALFEGYSFAKANPVSIAMQKVLDTLHEHNLAKEADSLQKFYESVQRRASGINTAVGKQRIIVELYEKFFRNAFPKMTERLGIVYTPVEVVDFIIHSVDEVLRSEFGQTLGSAGVHILDPFAGTGTFITRLLQSGLIAPEELSHKYRHEIHANEIVLLAYYLAAINIEAAYHDIAGIFTPFEGICLTDTFQLYEQDRDLLSGLLADNSNRRTRQKSLDIRVIMGNPPYSAGQGSANDNAANLSYPKLDGRIRDTYAERSTATLKNSLYDSYIRAIRWGSDRIGSAGVLAYVSNAGWLDGTAADGMRKCLSEEFASVHVFHLRGNQRTSGERSRREGGKIFGGGSRAPIAIMILTKNPAAFEQGRVQYHDIGEYLSRSEKLARISRFGSIGGIGRENGWQVIQPDRHGDWLKQRDCNFDDFIKIGDKTASGEKRIFSTYFNGVKTGRDVWCFNSSRQSGQITAEKMLSFYNSEVARYVAAASPSNIEDFINTDPKRISWNRMARQKLGKHGLLDRKTLVSTLSLYRPFFKQALHIYLDITDLSTVVRNVFPTEECKNLAIIIPGNGAAAEFTPLMVNMAPSLQPYHNTQCFPRYLYDATTQENTDQGSLLLGGGTPAGWKRRDAITDEGLAHFQAAYPGEPITKDDVFFYVYGVLHSEDYREQFADNLSKELPRIPTVRSAEDFRAFVDAGRLLSDLHCNYDEVEPYPTGIAQGDLRLAHVSDPTQFYRVEQMRFAGKRPYQDRTSLIYNANITLTGIPLEAYDYVVNGKPALEWVIERQRVSTDKASGIINDANLYATETVGDPAYPLKLFQRVITVSMRTLEIVRSLPKLEVMVVGSSARPADRTLTGQEVRDGIMAHWGETEITSTAIKIVDFLAKLDKDKRAAISFGDIAEWLGQEELTAEILSALNILVGSEFGVLRARGYFLGDDEERYELTPEDFRQIFRSGILNHPSTGEPVHNPARHVVPVFELSADLSDVEVQ